MMLKNFFLFIITLFLLACNKQTQRSEIEFETEGWAETAGSTGILEVNKNESSSEGDNSSGEPNNEKLDLSQATPDLPKYEECEAIDFLFVIDNSGSMSDNQMNLIANFPEFANGIKNNIPQLVDYHIGVVTTDDYSANEEGCKNLGALVTQVDDPLSFALPPIVCGPFDNGNRFISKNDDLNTSFSCIANVGTYGSGNERPLDAMIEALDPFENTEGQCNEGFLREEVPLVIIIITDEEDSSGGNAQHFYDKLAWTAETFWNKSVDDIVILSLIAHSNFNSCSGTDGTKIAEFTYKFTYGIVSDICSEDYGTHFDQAVSWIVASCQDLPPPIS